MRTTINYRCPSRKNTAMYITDYKDKGWNIRSTYEDFQPDLLETEAFFMAFAKIHNLDGHKIMCVLTPVKHQKLTQSYEHEGVTHSQSVLIVSSSDVKGFKINDTLRIDNRLFVIDEVSRPAGDIVRLVLSSND